MGKGGVNYCNGMLGTCEEPRPEASMRSHHNRELAVRTRGPSAVHPGRGLPHRKHGLGFSAARARRGGAAWAADPRPHGSLSLWGPTPHRWVPQHTPRLVNQPRQPLPPRAPASS